MWLDDLSSRCQRSCCRHFFPWLSTWTARGLCFPTKEFSNSLRLQRHSRVTTRGALPAWSLLHNSLSPHSKIALLTEKLQRQEKDRPAFLSDTLAVAIQLVLDLFELIT